MSGSWNCFPCRTLFEPSQKLDRMEDGPKALCSPDAADLSVGSCQDAALEREASTFRSAFIGGPDGPYHSEKSWLLLCHTHLRTSLGDTLWDSDLVSMRCWMNDQLLAKAWTHDIFAHDGNIFQL